MKTSLLLIVLCSGWTLAHQEPEYKTSREASIFIRRSDVLADDYLLSPVLRPYDAKDVADSTQDISSLGEGWLNEDSLPVGTWSFYATDEAGKEYLFKQGTYSLVKASSFWIAAGDTMDIESRFGLTPEALRRNAASSTPFVKSGTWTYFHPNGKLWKKVQYSAERIPVQLLVVSSENEPDQLMATGNAHQGPDEYIRPDQQVTEYSSAGNRYKELRYTISNRVILKTYYDNRGKIRYQEKQSAAMDEISPTWQ